jgi:hypothetical protein
MPNPAAATRPRPHPPPRCLLRTVLEQLCTGPRSPRSRSQPAAPTIATLTARTAHLALLAGIAGLELGALTATAKRTPPDRGEQRDRTTAA